MITFNTFLLLDAPKCSEIARWNILRGILSYKKVPYDILNGENKNFYYTELKELVLSPSCHYALKSMELSEVNKKLLAEKKKEYIELNKCFVITKALFELILEKKWKEVMATISLLHNKLVKINPKQDIMGQFLQFASYILTLVAFRYCALIDTKNLKGESQQAQEFLELMIYCLNSKNTIKPSPLCHQQICSNLEKTMAYTGRHNIKEQDMIIFRHHVRKIKDRQEFLPSFDVSALISSDLLSTLSGLEKNDALFYVSDKQNIYEFENLFQKVCHESLNIWVEIEQHIRKKHETYNQDMRLEKEMITWVNE